MFLSLQYSGSESECWNSAVFQPQYGMQYSPCPQDTSVPVAVTTLLVEKVASPVIPFSYLSETTSLCSSVFPVSDVLQLTVLVDEETAKENADLDSITYTTVWESSPSLDLDCSDGACIVQNGGNGESSLTLLPDSLQAGRDYIFNVTVKPLGDTALTFVRSFSPLCLIQAVGDPVPGRCYWKPAESSTTGCESEALQLITFVCEEWEDPSNTGLLYQFEYMDVSSQDWVGLGPPTTKPTSPYLLHLPYFRPFYVRARVLNLLGGSTTTISQVLDPCLPDSVTLTKRIARARELLSECTEGLDVNCQTRQLLSISSISRVLNGTLLVRQNMDDCLATQVTHTYIESFASH